MVKLGNCALIVFYVRTIGTVAVRTWRELPVPVLLNPLPVLETLFQSLYQPPNEQADIMKPNKKATKTVHQLNQTWETEM